MVRTLSSEYTAPLKAAAACSERYIHQIFERTTAISEEAIGALSALDTALPSRGEQASRVIQLLDSFGSPATAPTMGGRFFGGVIGGALPASVAAHWLASAWDQNACLYEFSPVGAHLEDVALRWVTDLLGLPSESAGGLVNGTQGADIAALAAARHAALASVDYDERRSGVFAAPTVNVVVSDETHATMYRALSLLGFGRDKLHIVPSDEQGRIKPREIPRLPGPTIICAQVGNVNSGACDDLDKICDIAKDLGAWVHVDGAFGLWAAVSPRRSHLFKGVSRANSWALDAHKWLNVSYDCGIALVRDPHALQDAMELEGAYYPESVPGRRQSMYWVHDSSRRARGVELWATLLSLGRLGVIDLIERTCEHALSFSKMLRAHGFEILNEVVLNQVLVRFHDDDATKRLVSAIQKDGTCWVGGTVWKGRAAMRISVSSWATTTSDVEQSVEAMVRLALQL